MQLTAVISDEDQTASKFRLSGRSGWHRCVIDFDERRTGAPMRRLIILAATVVLGSAWQGVAFAQLGIPSLGMGEPGSRTPSLRPQLRRPMRNYTAAPVPPPPLGATARGRSSRAGSGLFSLTGINDDTGRTDLSGRPASHYPTVRGEISGASGAHFPRGGANGPPRPSSARKPPEDPLEATLPPH
jgi:hypothetical protein